MSLRIREVFTADATKVRSLWKGTDMEKRKKRKDSRVYSYSAVIVLFAVCIAVTVILLLALFGIEETNPQEDQIISEEIQETLEVEPAEESRQAGQTVSEGDNAAGSQTTMEETESAAVETEPEAYEFTVSDKSYFDDALFIGDSRTVGLREYGTLENADYFASSGLNLYTIERTKVDLNETEKITLDDMLQQNTYGKIYIMLGINELGYDFDTTIEKYQTFIDYLFTMQPDTILYVCANLHVNYLRDELDEIHNNEAINRMNEAISAFADQKNIFYLDVNPLFDDEKGNLAEEYISDDTHVMGIYYETWCDWYCQNTIVK